MLAIILFILKLLGILLLIVLGLIVLVLFLVLFASVKYTSKGSKHGEELQVQALVTYLNPIGRVKVHYPDETILQVKIMGITIYPTKAKKGNKSEADVAGKKSTVAEADSAETKAAKTKVDSTATKNTETKVDNASQKTIEPETDDVTDKESSTFNTVRAYISLFQENKGLILEVFKVVLNALKTVLPRKCYIKAVFGTGQADTTGFIYAAYCSLQEYLPGEIILEPVWTEAHAEGEYYLKGKVRVIHFVAALIKIIANRDVRLLFKKIRSVK